MKKVYTIWQEGNTKYVWFSNLVPLYNAKSDIDYYNKGNAYKVWLADEAPSYLFNLCAKSKIPAKYKR